jgi:alpha-mannosidase
LPKIREVLIVPHTHHDVGYTHMPDICMEAHERGIHEAIRFCEMDLGSDAPHAFRWTVEVSRSLLQFLRQATDGEAARLQRLVAAGRIAVTAGYLHMTQQRKRNG